MTSKEQFRLGVLCALARQGLSPGEALALVKEARAKQAGALDALGAVGKGLLSWPLTVGMAGLGTAAVGGAAAGHFAAQATDHDVTPDDLKKYELIAAYQQQTEKAKRNARVNYLEARPQGGFRR